MANTIKSPFPGTFYERPNPESAPYVTEGAEVSVGDVVGLVEIMKNFHEITAGEAGTVARVLVENEALIEAGQDVIELE